MNDNLDVLQLKQFFNQIYGDEKGWFCLPCMNHCNKKWEQFDKHYFYYPSDLDKALNHISTENQSGKCVYFTPSLYITKGSTAKGKAMKNTWLLFADIDEHNDPKRISPQPGILWETSPGRYQAIWLLKASVPWNEAESINQHLTYHIGADEGGWARNKVLRIPESLSYKYEQPYQGRLMWTNGQTYSLQEIKSFTNYCSCEDIPNYSSVQDMSNELPSYEEIVASYREQIPLNVLELLETEPVKTDDRSEKLNWLYLSLNNAGLSAEEIFVLVRNSKWNKFYPNNERLINDILRVLEKSTSAKPFNETLVENKETGLSDKEAYIIAEVNKARMPFQEWVKLGESTAAKAIIPGLLYSGSLILIHGPSKVGKSTFISYLINAITVGRLDLTLDCGVFGNQRLLNTEVLGRPLPVNPQRVVLISEEHSSLWADRLQLADWNMIEILPSHLVKQWAARGNIASVLKVYEYLSEAEKPDIIIFDPLLKLLSIEDENSSAEVEKKLGSFEEFSHRTGISVMFIHHPRKSGGDHGEEIRGSSAIAANPDYIINFNRSSGERRHNHRTLKFIGRYAGLPRTPLGIIWDEESNNYKLDDALPRNAEAKILHILSREENSLTRKEIEKQTGLAEKTVREKLKILVDNNKVSESEEVEGRGSPKKKYALFPEITINENLC